MPQKPLEAIAEHFSKVTDPRMDRTKEHKLIDMIAIAICAVICGAEGWTDIENFGNSKLPWLKTFLELPNDIPSHDTFGRVFSMLDAQQFQLAFYEWHEPAYISDLEEILETAKKFLEAGDAEDALIILRVLLEETLEDYDGEMDYNGDVAGFIQDLGMPMAEAILSLEMESKSRTALQESIDEILDDLDVTIEESELQVIHAVLEHGWDELPDPEFQWKEYDEEDWMLFGELQQARLKVLKRQGRKDEFLLLAQKADPHRYALELLQLGQVNEAIKASQELR